MTVERFTITGARDSDARQVPQNTARRRHIHGPIMPMDEPPGLLKRILRLGR